MQLQPPGDTTRGPCSTLRLGLYSKPPRHTEIKKRHSAHIYPQLLEVQEKGDCRATGRLLFYPRIRELSFKITDHVSTDVQQGASVWDVGILGECSHDQHQIEVIILVAFIQQSFSGTED